MSKRKTKDTPVPPAPAETPPLRGWGVGDFAVTPDCDHATLIDCVNVGSLSGPRVLRISAHGCGCEGYAYHNGLVEVCDGVAIAHYDRYVVRVSREELIATGLEREALRALARSRIPSAHDALQDERAASLRLIDDRNRLLKTVEQITGEPYDVPAAAVNVAVIRLLGLNQERTDLRDTLALAQRACTEHKAAADTLRKQLAVQEAAATETSRRLVQERDQARDALTQAHARVDVLQRLTGELRAERDRLLLANEGLQDALGKTAEDRDRRLAELAAQRDALAVANGELAPLATRGAAVDLDLAPLREAFEGYDALDWRCRFCAPLWAAVKALLEAYPAEGSAASTEPPNRGAAECCEYSTVPEAEPPPQVALIDDLAPAPCAGEPADAALAAQVGAAAADQSGEVTEMVEETAAVDPLEAARLIDAGTPPLLGSRPSPICGARNGHLFCERLADHAGEHVASDRADPVRWDAAPAFLVSQVRAGARAYKRQRVVAPIKPRRHPCPVCRRGAGEVHVCCPRCATRGRVTAVARTEEQVRALFGTRDNGTAAQPWCLVCRREVEAERAPVRRAAQSDSQPATESAEAT